MRVLIIGGTNFTGPYVVRRLTELGYELMLYHRNQVRPEFNDLIGNQYKEVHHILDDRDRIADHADELLCFAPEIVVDMIATTERQARNLAALFSSVARRIIAISSQDVYRAYGRLIELEPGPLEPLPLSEDAPLRKKHFPYRRQLDPGHRFYDYEKILVEKVYLSAPNLMGTILRYPMVYGPGDRQHRLFPYLKRMDDGRPAILLGKRQANWRWSKGYVENVAEAVVLAVCNDNTDGRIYNVGELQTFSESEWVRAIGEAAGWQGEIVTIPDYQLPPHLQPDFNSNQHLIIDTRRIREELAYKESISKNLALERTIAWERAHIPDVFDEQNFDYCAEDAVLANI